MRDSEERKSPTGRRNVYRWKEAKQKIVTWEKCIMLSSDISARRNIHITHSRRTVKVTALDKGIYLLSISTNIHHSMIEFSEFSPKIEPTRESMYINKYL
jgi:hypothetical protein